MLIPITFNTPSSSTTKLPPSLAKISHDEVVLLELQGSLEIESSHPNERDGKLVGTLTIDTDLVSGVKLPLSIAQLITYQFPFLPCLCPYTAFSTLGTQKRPVLRIGHHLIEGKLANLPKPLAVLQKQTTTRGSASISASRWSGDGDPDEEEMMQDREETLAPADAESVESSESAVQWNAIAIIKRKIVFSKRPMPIVGKLS